MDRRIYRVDRWALPVPGGVPLRGMGYFATTLVLVVVLGQLPGVSVVLGALNAPLRYVLLPLAVAMLASQASPDGRPAHRFVLAWVGLRLRAPVQPVRWHGKLRMRWDEDAPELHRSRVRGPATVDFRVPVRFNLGWRGSFVARPDARGIVGPYEVEDGETLKVRP